ncbi:MAG: alpha/beta hydrolase [Actinomycetota bacterium]|nr:alpha/beta hydrolase [Actinomycetota bacterium]
MIRRSHVGGLATVGMVVAGAAARTALNRKAARRHALTSAGPEPLGSLRGDIHPVRTEDGLDLFVEVDEPDGDGSGLTVVFAHGYALNLDCWHFQRAALRGRHRLVFYDQRSHGRSMRSDDAHSNIEQLGRDLRRVIDKVAPRDRVVLVGHSMGGMGIMALAEQAPKLFGKRVVGVALLATSAGDLDRVTLGLPGRAGRLLHRVGPSALATLARVPAVVERGRKAGSEFAYMLTQRFAFGGPVEPEVADFAEQMLAATPIGVIAAFFPGFAEHDRFAALAALRQVPVLVVGGSEDKMTPASHSREIAHRLPSAYSLDLDGAGHLLMLECADEVNRALDELLARAAAEAVA